MKPDPSFDFEKLRNGRPSLTGYRVTEIGGGRSRLDWTPTDAMANPVGMVHGGFVGLIVDDTCGTAVSSILDEWRPFPTASMHIEFLRGIKVGGTYVSRGRVVRAGRRITVADAEIWDEHGQLLARGTCTFALDLGDSPAVGFTTD